MTVLFALCVCALPAHADRNDRGITSLKAKGEPFVREGVWTVGGTASVSTFGADKYAIAIINDINFEGYNVSLSPDAMYAFADDFVMGVSLGYSRDKMNLHSAGVTISSVGINVNDYNSISSDMMGTVFFRKYLTLGTSGRFALYADGGLSISGGRSRISNRQTGSIVGTYEKNFKVSVNVNPGFAAYITDHLALCIGTGILGVECSWTDQIHNQVATGSREGFGASCILNILALRLGVYYSF